MRVVIAMYDVLLHTLSIITPTPAVVIVNTTDQYNRSLYWLHTAVATANLNQLQPQKSLNCGVHDYSKFYHNPVIDASKRMPGCGDAYRP